MKNSLIIGQFLQEFLWLRLWLIISGLLLEHLGIEYEYHAEKLDTVTLKGKESALELFSLNQAQQ